MISPSALHPRAVKAARHRPVYWLAGLSVPSAFPEQRLQWLRMKGSSPLTVAGAAAALKLSLFTAFPSCVPLVMREPTTLGTIDWTLAAASPIRHFGVSVDKSGAQAL
jgi:hypothetical protein